VSGRELTAGDVVALLLADATVRSANRALEQAKEARARLRDELAPAVPYDAPQTAAGHRIVRRAKSTGERVDLKGCRARYAVPKRLERFITASSYDDWQITPAPDED
jgi:hypothetical protein